MNKYHLLLINSNRIRFKCMYVGFFYCLLYSPQKVRNTFSFFRLYVNKSFDLKPFFSRDSLNYTSSKEMRKKKKIQDLLEIKVGRNNFYFLKWKMLRKKKMILITVTDCNIPSAQRHKNKHVSHLSLCYVHPY